MQHFSPVKKRCDTETSLHTQEETKEETTQKYHDLKQRMYAITRNANKRLKRREAVIQQQKTCIDSQRYAIQSYERKIKVAESQVIKLRAKVNRVSHRASYWRSKVSGIAEKNSAKRSELRHEIETLREKVSTLDLHNAEMSETIDSILHSETIATFDGGKYTDDVRACIYELLSLNVGVSKIAPVIRCVLKNIAHKSASRLPSHGLTCQMILESLTIVQAQLGDQLLQTAGYNTLQTDGTTKFGEHYGTYDVSVSSSGSVCSYGLGIRHVFSGSAVDTLDTLKEILDDIDCVSTALGRGTVSAKIVSKLKNTMSDRHAAEKLFNEMLHDFTVDVLPTVVENWNQISEPEREQLTRMNNFFCGLHFLVGLADAAEEAVKLWETRFNSLEASTSSGTQRLVRTACKAFHHKGSQQCGSSTLFRTYLRKEGIHSIPLAHFVGNRFNILFYDAAGVYYLQNHMRTFIETVHGGHANRLLQAVIADLKNPVYTSGCRALGVVDKAVTGPLWRQLQESSMSVLEMGSVYCEMKRKFDNWSDDAHTLLEGIALFDNTTFVRMDEVWKILLKSNETDVMTQELLQLLFAAFSLTTQRLLIDHLPGGKYYSITDAAMVQETASVPKTNVAPERDFAVLDRLIREKPNASVIALESMILYSHNRTSSWLEKQSGEERKKLFEAARNLAPAIRRKFIERRQKIEERREQALSNKQEDIARKQIVLVREREKLTKEVEKVGLWINLEDVECGLEAVSKKADKLKVLKMQIKFRQKVLGQSHSDSSLFKFSHGGKPHSVDQLKQNLCQLLMVAVDQDCTMHTNQRDSTLALEDVLLQPELLVGRRVKHRFEVDNELIWFNGSVLQMNSETNEFQIAYDGEDDVCWFPLLDDARSGDLLLNI